MAVSYEFRCPASDPAALGKRHHGTPWLLPIAISNLSHRNGLKSWDQGAGLHLAHASYELRQPIPYEAGFLDESQSDLAQRQVQLHQRVGLVPKAPSAGVYPVNSQSE